MHVVKTRVALLLEIPTPYRDPLVARLAEEDAFDLTILYCAERDPWREWDIGDAISRGEVLPGFGIGGKSGGLNLKVNVAVWRRLNEVSPQVVVVGGYANFTMQLAILWCRLKRIPYIVMSESHDLNPRPLWRRVVKTPVARWAIGGASALLPTGSHARDYLARLGGDVSSMFLFPNVPDVHALSRKAILDPADRLSLRQRFALGPGPMVLYVGRLVKFKNVDLLVRAFASLERMLPASTLVIIGSGPEETRLKSEAAVASPSIIRFEGFVQPDELIAYYSAADVFVLPSQIEPWGVVVLEALACGTPVVVSSSVGCARDVIREGENGMIVSPGDEPALTRALHRTALEGGVLSVRERVQRRALEWDYESCIRMFHEAVTHALG